jgi:hypothetical protein
LLSALRGCRHFGSSSPSPNPRDFLGWSSRAVTTQVAERVRWELAPSRRRPIPVDRTTVVLYPNGASSLFKVVKATRPAATRTVDVVAELGSRSKVALVLRRAAFVP